MNDWFDRLTHHWNSFYTCLAEVRTTPNMLYLCPGIPEMPLICNQKKGSPKTTRQDSPEKKTHNKIKKQKPQKQSWQVLLILCFPSLFFFLCALVLYFLNRYILYAVRLKSLVYKKDQNKLLTVIFGPREKEESKMYERKGDRPTPP